jgi:hypothetical protein
MVSNHLLREFLFAAVPSPARFLRFYLEHVARGSFPDEILRLGNAERGIHTCFLTHRLRNAATALVTLRGRIVVFMRASIGFYAEHGDLPMVPKMQRLPACLSGA